MKYLYLTIFFQLAIAQKITIQDVFASHLFYPNTSGLERSTQDGMYAINIEGDGIFKKSFKNNQSTLVTTLQNPEKIKDFEMSNDEQKVLLQYNKKGIYRYSYTADYKILDIKTKEYTPLDTAPISYPSFNANSTKIAYVKNNNLYCYDTDNKFITIITTDGIKNKIINGASDWVHEEEFELVQAYQWSPNGKKIAYYKFDETEVPEISLQGYVGKTYPTEYTYKYPKVGERNSKISIWIYDIDTKSSVKIIANTAIIEYFPKILWTPSNELVVCEMNRSQNELKLEQFNLENNSQKIIYSEKNDKYIEATQLFLHFLNNKEGFFISSDKDGVRNIYWYDNEGKIRQQLTSYESITIAKSHPEVTQIYGVDEKESVIYYQANYKEGTPLELTERYIWMLNYNKKSNKIKTKLLPQQEKGTNNAEFSNLFNFYTISHSSANKPYTVNLYSKNQQQIQTLENNAPFIKHLEPYSLQEKKILQIPNEIGIPLNTFIIEPKNYDKNKQYPLYITVYGGPGRNTVENEWDWDMGWYQYLAQEGYFVASIDPRGTEWRGTDFKKTTYKQMGLLESEDVKYITEALLKKYAIDKSKVVIQGWSYGGYLASLCLFKYPEVFSKGIAVAPVSNWLYYDNIYTERYMGLKENNIKGYNENAPTFYAKNLKRDYLLIHGTSDDNVHLQNSMEIANTLIANNKDFDMFLYPNKNHSIYGGYTRWHLFNKIKNFIDK